VGHGLPLTLTAGAASTFANTLNGTTLTWTADAPTDADAALLQIGDFISFDNTAGVWRSILTIDLAARVITWSGGAWPAVVTAAAHVMSAWRPAIPDSIDPGASTWEDTATDLSALGFGDGDYVVVTRPSTFAGTIQSVGLDTGSTSKVNLDGSFLAATRTVLGTAQLTNGDTAVTVAAGTADFTAIKVLVDAGENVALFEPISGAFIAISAVASSTALTLAAAWPANALGVPQAVHAAYMGPTATISYSVNRDRPDLSLPRVDWDFLGVVVTATAITIPAGLTSGGFSILTANLVTNYRALDETKAALVDYANLAELTAAYAAGSAALVPSNPLGYAASIALQNTSNPVWCIGYDESFYTSEATAFTEVLALLEEQTPYTLVVCSMTGDLLAPALKSHIDDQSGITSVPVGSKTFFRIGTFNRRRITQEEMVAAATTAATAPEGIAATGLTFNHISHGTGFVLDGVIAGHKLQVTQAVGPQQAFAGQATPSTRVFTDENSPGFGGAVIGDDLVIETGTDAGTYSITQVTDISVGGVVTGGSITAPVGNLSGDDVSGEIAEASTTPIVVGVLAPTALVEAPMVAETLVLTGDVAVVAVESGIPGPDAVVGTHTFTIPGPIKAATALTLVVDSSTVSITDADVFSVAGGTLALTLGSCLINRTTGLITIVKTNADDHSPDFWVVTYTGFISAVCSAAGAITGAGVIAGTLNETTGAFSAFTTPYNAALGGAVTHGTNLTAAYRPRQTYHIVYKSTISPIVTTEPVIASLTQDVLTFAASILPAQIVGPLRSVAYRVVKDMTLTEQATALAGIASSPSISSRRMVMIWPDIATAPLSNLETQVPGWAFAAGLGALVDTLPSQQGLTRRGVVGVTSRVGGKDTFRTGARLNIIAGGGVMLFENDGVGQGVYIRHQLTADLTSVLTQELSMTKNIDSVAKEIQSALEDLLGTWNVQEGLFMVMKMRIGGLINKFVNTRVARLGGKMKPGSKLLAVVEHATLPDTVLVTIDGRFPVPLNHITLTIQASS
jgi:hypothetical protein